MNVLPAQAGDRIEQMHVFIRRKKSPQFRLKGGIGAGARKEAVYSRCNRGIDKSLIRVDFLQFVYDVRSLPQIVFLMIIFRWIEPPGRSYLREYLCVCPCLLLFQGFKGEVFLLPVMEEDGGDVLSRPRPASRVMALPKDFKQFPV